MNEQKTRRTSTVRIHWTTNGCKEKNSCDYISNTVAKENRPNNACELIVQMLLLVLFSFSDSWRYHLTMQRFMTYVSVISFVICLSFVSQSKDRKLRFEQGGICRDRPLLLI